jgi:hypothetical protein
METILWIVLAITFALLVYTIIWVALGIQKKAQPSIDSFFNALHDLWSAKTSPRPDDQSIKSRAEIPNSDQDKAAP